MLYYTGIGSRDIPTHIAYRMRNIASLFENKGYILRSGGAEGSDQAFEDGVCKPTNKHIYLPYDGFMDKYHNGVDYIFIDCNHRDYNKAFQSLIYHPKGFGLSTSHRNMMIRNYFQIYGTNNEGLSKFVICYTDKGKLVGGTAQALRLAMMNDIIIYNLGDIRNLNYSDEEIVEILTSNNEATDECVNSIF